MAARMTALERATEPTTASRPDKSPAAIARRRELDRRAVASNALEECYPDPACEYIHELWILGEITDEKRHTMLGEYLKAKLGR